MSIQVEVDLYSGRRSPVFTLPSSAGSEIRKRLAALPPVKADMPGLQDGLGYRGMRIIGTDNEFSEIFVGSETIEIRDYRGNITRRADPGRRFERWLIRELGGEGQNDERDFVRYELGQ